MAGRPLCVSVDNGDSYGVNNVPAQEAALADGATVKVPLPDGAADATANYLTAGYDAWGRLVDVNSNGNVLISDGSFRQTAFAYDALGRRITSTKYGPSDTSKSSPLDTVQSFYSGNQLIEERDAGVVQTQYVWSPNGQLILRDDENAALSSNTDSHIPQMTGAPLNERLYAQQDAAGSVTSITDLSGLPVERFIYNQDGRPTAIQPNWTAWTAASSSGSPTSHFDWQFLYKSMRWQWVQSTNAQNGLSFQPSWGLYQDAGGQWFDPNNARMMVPDSAAVAGNGWNAYDSTGGENGLSGWYDRNAGHIAAGSAIGIGATLTVATGGLALAYAPELLGLANGAIITAATSTGGAWVGGGVATAMVWGMIRNPEFREMVLSSTDPQHLAEIPLAAVQFASRDALPGIRAAGAWLAENGSTFASGFATGLSEPVAIYVASFGGDGFAGGVRVVNGVRAGFAELRGLSFVRSAVSSEDMGVQLGRKFLLGESGLNLQEAGWVNPITPHGFDDVLEDAEGGLWGIEYKGGTGALEGDQMSERWAQDVLDRMTTGHASLNPWGQRIQAAFDSGNLRGITVSSPGPLEPTVVVKLRAYNIGM